MIIYDRMVYSKVEPKTTNVVWLKPEDGDITFNVFIDGKWEAADPQDCYTKKQVDLLLANKANTDSNVSSFTNDAGYLTASDLKTINGVSLVGEGDIVIPSNEENTEVDNNVDAPQSEE